MDVFKEYDHIFLTTVLLISIFSTFAVAVCTLPTELHNSVWNYQYTDLSNSAQTTTLTFGRTTLTEPSNIRLNALGTILNAWTCISNLTLSSAVSVAVFKSDKSYTDFGGNTKWVYLCMKLTKVADDFFYFYLLSDPCVFRSPEFYEEGYARVTMHTENMYTSSKCGQIEDFSSEKNEDSSIFPAERVYQSISIPDNTVPVCSTFCQYTSQPKIRILKKSGSSTTLPGDISLCEPCDSSCEEATTEITSLKTTQNTRLPFTSSEIEISTDITSKETTQKTMAQSNSTEMVTATEMTPLEITQETTAQSASTEMLTTTDTTPLKTTQQTTAQSASTEIATTTKTTPLKTTQQTTEQTTSTEIVTTTEMTPLKTTQQTTEQTTSTEIVTTTEMTPLKTTQQTTEQTTSTEMVTTTEMTPLETTLKTTAQPTSIEMVTTPEMTPLETTQKTTAQPTSTVMVTTPEMTPLETTQKTTAQSTSIEMVTTPEMTPLETTQKTTAQPNSTVMVTTPEMTPLETTQKTTAQSTTIEMVTTPEMTPLLTTQKTTAQSIFSEMDIMTEKKSTQKTTLPATSTNFVTTIQKTTIHIMVDVTETNSDINQVNKDVKDKTIMDTQSTETLMIIIGSILLAVIASFLIGITAFVYHKGHSEVNTIENTREKGEDAYGITPQICYLYKGKDFGFQKIAIRHWDCH